KIKLRLIYFSVNSTFSGNCQSIGVSPNASKAALVFENGRDPKNPLLAERGLGCGDSIMIFFFLSIKAAFFLAAAPHNIKTTGIGLSESFLIASSVNFSQPFPLWENACRFVTVKTEFNIKTPCLAHVSR